MGELECSREELNQMKWTIYKQFPGLMQGLAVLYQELKENEKFWGETAEAEVRTVVNILCNCAVLFALPAQLEEKCGQIRDIVATMGQEESEKFPVLEEMYKVMEELMAYIGSKAKHCNVCQNGVFFLTFPDSLDKMRRQCGFPYWNADFQLESRENYRCPICGAYDRDRLIIAFLEEVQAEGDEKLRVLQIAPSPSIERYALGRADILYESTDLMMPNVSFQADLQHMDMVEDETYDVIVCSHVLEHVRDDALAMRELYRILKPSGVCLVLVPLIVGKADTEEQWGCEAEENWRRFGQGDHSRLYGKRDFIHRLQQEGFYVNELGKGWFGEEFYREYGFDELSVLYVATKEIRLVEQQEDRERELAELRDENRLLRQALEDINARLVELDKAVGTNNMIFAYTLENIGWEINDPRFQERLWYPKIMSVKGTIDAIVEQKKSIARFGDGEFGIICGIQRWRFQKKDERLAYRLKEVLQSQHDNILIGLSDWYGKLDDWDSKAANGARIYLTPEVRKQHYALLNPQQIYANARISRSVKEEDFNELKRIWEGRDCIFVEGFQTRMGVGNDLFDNADSIARILCPAENAFDHYEEIYREVLKQPRDRLILIALGPTASVLAYDLAMQGYQAVDVGHADLSYEWLCSGSHGKVYGKYSNEAPGGYIVEDIHNADYEAQIIADIR